MQKQGYRFLGTVFFTGNRLSVLYYWRIPFVGRPSPVPGRWPGESRLLRWMTSLTRHRKTVSTPSNLGQLCQLKRLSNFPLFGVIVYDVYAILPITVACNQVIGILGVSPICIDPSRTRSLRDCGRLGWTDPVSYDQYGALPVCVCLRPVRDGRSLKRGPPRWWPQAAGRPLYRVWSARGW